MSDPNNLRDTIVPKSDQLNADDLIGATRDITITAVRRGESPDQPVSIHYDGDSGRPYKPCKSMRRVMIHAWGDDGRAWVGERVRLYCDPEVMFGGVKVGGIRISHMTGIPSTQHISLTQTRGKRKPYTVEPLTIPAYPVADFDKNFPKWAAAIREGKKTPEQIIAAIEKRGTITDQQRQRVIAAAAVEHETETTEQEEF